MDSVPSDSKVSLHAYVTLLMWRNPTTGLHKTTKNGVQSNVHGQVNVYNHTT
jgi:exonuclease VII large subunit